MKIVKIDKQYVDYLNTFDSRVSEIVSNKADRPYVGIIYHSNGFDWFAPLTSPKAKHRNLPNMLDFLKIDQGILGAINLNNSIPVKSNYYTKIDTDYNPKDTPSEKYYKRLIVRQLAWIKNHNDIIQKNASILYSQKCNKQLSESLDNRTCDFKVLEEACENYQASIITDTASPTQKTIESQYQFKVPRNAEDYKTIIANMFIEGLEKDGLQWKKGWSQLASQHNPITKTIYKGNNEVLLNMVAVAKNYQDPRWLTYNQISDVKGIYHKGEKWHLKAGTKGVPVQYWYPYDREGKKQISWDEYNKKIAEGANKDDYLLSTSYSMVFNASQIEGISEYELVDNHLNIDDQLINKISTEMNVPIHYGGGRAYYVPSKDEIHLPQIQTFETPEAYYSTALHELSHSTAHETRLNRNINNAFGTSDYAYEELIAEISSAMLSSHFTTDISYHIDNHQAYVNGWIKAIKEHPDALYDAIKEAQKASFYIEDKAGLVVEKIIQNSNENTEEKKTTQEQLTELFANKSFEEIKANQEYYESEKAKILGQTKVEKSTENLNKSTKRISLETLKNGIDIKEYARTIDLNLVRKGRLYSIQEHDSCMIYPDNHFHRFSNGAHGSIIDFIMEFENVDLNQAIVKASEYYEVVGGTSTSFTSVEQDIRLVSPTQKTGKYANKEITEYLNKRGISTPIIDKYIDEGIIYQDTYNNLVVISKDPQLNEVGYSLRGTKSTFKGKAEGSKFSYGVTMNIDAQTVVITESTIDQMSYIELYDDHINNGYLSVESANNTINCIDNLIENNKSLSKIVMALDNDFKGQQTQLEAIKHIQEHYPTLIVEYDIPEGKDWNNDLCVKKNSASQSLNASKAAAHI